MDSELKRRLVGTIIIVSLVVIFVPMLFEEKDDLSQDSRETRIPEFPQDFDSQVIPLPDAVPEAKALKEPAPEAAEEPEVAPVVRRDDALDPLDVSARKSPGTLAEEPGTQPLAPEDEDDFAKPAARPPAAAKPGAVPLAPAVKPGVKAPAESAAKTTKPAAEPAPKPAASKPAKKKTVTTTALPKPAAPAITPVTGAASESAPAGAAKPETKTPVAGAPEPVAKAASPTPAPAADTATAAKEPASLSWWMIQAGSFDDETNAKNLKTRLLQAKIPAFSEKVTGPNGTVKYRVRVGPEKERAKAEEVLKRMESEAGVKGMIVSYP